MDRVVYKKGRLSSRRNSDIASFNTLFNSTLSQILLIGISIFLLYNVFHSVSIMIQKVDIQKRAEQEVNDLRIRNLELSLMLENMQDTEYLEVQARDRLNYAVDGEYVFVIPEDVLENSKEEVSWILYGEEEEDVSVLDIWKDFLLRGV